MKASFIFVSLLIAAPFAHAWAEADPHSYAQPGKVAVTSVDLDLSVDFSHKQLVDARADGERETSFHVLAVAGHPCAQLGAVARHAIGTFYLHGAYPCAEGIARGHER